MADDLEAFLRQAAQRRAARKKSARPLRPSQPTASPPPSKPPSKPTAGRRKPPVAPPSSVPPPAKTGVKSTLVDTSDIEQHAKHLSDHAQHLGDDVDQSDERLEARLHAKFDHQLGDLGGSEMISDDMTHVSGSAVKPSELSQTLRDPTSLRQAIILSEILNPPQHRW